MVLEQERLVIEPWDSLGSPIPSLVEGSERRSGPQITPT
jgi:hypothetical protein